MVKVNNLLTGGLLFVLWCDVLLFVILTPTFIVNIMLLWIANSPPVLQLY